MHAAPDVTIFFLDAKVAARLLSPKQNFYTRIDAMKNFKMGMFGPDDLALWLTDTMSIMQTVWWKYGADMGGGVMRYTNNTNGGPVHVDVKDGKILRIMPLNGMGRVLSAMGFGAVLGSVGVPALSDLIGRKRALALAAAVGFGATIAMSQVGAQPFVLFVWLFMIMFCVMGAITGTIGPLAASSLPPGMAATASGMVIAAGEFFGGGVAPILAGAVVERGGLPMLFPLAAIGLGVGVIAAAMLREPAVAMPE